MRARSTVTYFTKIYILILGLHLGHCPDSLEENTAISFSDPDVRDMLKSSLIDVLTTSVGDFQIVDRKGCNEDPRESV